MVRAPLHFHGRLPVPEVAPLTYRDGVTHLELVYELSQYLKKILHPSLQSTVNQVVADAERLLDEANDQYVDGVEEFRRIHDAFMSDVNASLVALNDSTVSDLVEDDTSLLGQILRRTFEPHGEVHRNTYERMGVVVPDELTFDQLQSAADEAYETGKRVWAAGELDTTETLIIRGDADLGGLTIHYTGNDVAVQVGVSTANTFDSVGTTPRVIHPGRDWSRDVTGVAFINVYSSVWTIPHVEGFTVGMDVVGDDSGNVYNTFTIGHLYGNRVNQRLRGINGGWSNQNTYIGGRYSHLTSQGYDVAGARHIELVESDHAVNNNLWLNPSIEGDTPEYHLYITGSYNVVLNGRYESSRATVYWGAGSSWNTLMYGYALQRIREVRVGYINSNSIVSSSSLRLAGGVSDGLITMQNSSSSLPNDVIYGAGRADYGYGAHSVSRSANETVMKRWDDDYPRARIDHVNGNYYFSNGSKDSEYGFGTYGSYPTILGFNTSRSPNNETTPTGWVELFVDGVQSFIPYYR